MNKKKRKIEESPTLSSLGNAVWVDRNSFPWVCGDELSGLFKLDGARRIVFVAKSKPDSTTYGVELSGDHRCPDLLEPIEVGLYSRLGLWLKRQIEEGRPNIGVRIISKWEKAK